MSRTNLPNRRPCETFTFSLAGLSYVASVGFDDKGRPMELFLGSGKAGTHLAIATQEAAILTSLAMQYGAPLETLRNASLRAEGGAAEGAVGHVLDLLWNRLNTKSPEAVT
jgi:ribonucleoside-diphosphate reductase alpha chain